MARRGRERERERGREREREREGGRGEGRVWREEGVRERENAHAPTLECCLVLALGGPIICRVVLRLNASSN